VKHSIRTYIHANRQHHELGIETYKWSVLGEAMLFDKPNLNRPQEIPIQSSINDQNEHFGDLVPDIVDFDECL
jgi:hypothetical protein